MAFDIRHLRHFEAVYRLRSFVRAADDQHVTQSALTKSIKHLEASLGAVLFDRTTRSVEPTELGDRLIHHATGAIAQVEGLIQEAQHHHGKLKGRVSVGSGPYPMQPLLTRTARMFADLNPDIHISLESSDPQNLLDRLVSRKLDLIVCDASKYEITAYTDKIQVDRLASDPIVMVHRADHPIVSSEITNARLQAYRWAAPGSSPHFLRKLPSKQKAASAKGDHPHYRCDTTAACIDMACAQGVLAVVPRSLALEVCRAGELKWTDFPTIVKTNDAVHTLKDRTPGPAVREFIALTKTVAEQIATEANTP